MNEARKGFNARHKNKVASIEPSKPRNFVAKNAINTGAGAHKDKKKSMKQGDTKHKKDYAEGMEEKFQAQLNELNQITEKWTQKYKSSINCSHPKGFSQKAHCAGKKKHNEDMTMEAVCPDCGMCQTHGNLSEIAKGAKDSNGYSSCWKGYHAAGTKKGKNGGRVRNCVPNEGMAEGGYNHGFADPLAPSLGRRSRDGDSGDDEPQGMFMVMIDGRPWKEFTSNMAFQRAKSIATKYPDKKVQVKWPTGQLNTVAEQGVAEGGVLKSIKRGMQGWGRDELPITGTANKPKDVVARTKSYDIDTAKMLRKDLDDAPEHTPAGLQKRVLDRKLKGVAEGLEELSRILDLSGLILTADEQFDIIESMVESWALHHGVDAETIWEDFESVDDAELLDESAAWHRSAGKSKKGGLNAKGVASYRAEHPGSHLQMAVTTKPSKLKPGSKAAKRRKSFCARMGGNKGPMKKPNGDPTRKALALRKWHCE